MKLDVEVIILLLWSFFLEESEEVGYCNFPDYLWTPLPDGANRKWISKTEYLENTVIWDRQKEIVARPTELVIKHKVHASCSEQQMELDVPCFRMDIHTQVICIAEEPGEKYRVQSQRDDGSESAFTCLRFKRINSNIIEVYSATPKEVNEDRLCYDESFHKEEWPWLAPSQVEWSPCPIIGGFDFRLFYPDGTEQCESVWRPSRLESECIYGEGINLYFPEKNCSPFSPQEQEVNLMCWGTWDDEHYKYVVLGKPERQAQYVLRFPREVDLLAEFTAHLYFSPVTPKSGQGEPPGKIKYMELHIKRSTQPHGDPGVCFDESEKCLEFAEQGKCTNSALHEYANYCKKSCGLCDFVPAPRTECRFPAEYRGEWMLFETDRKDSVTIGAGEITFSHLGHFICKSKHWSINRYKLLSVFTNGCRPRYTCIHFSEEGENVLKFQITRSRQTDESFHMCKFVNDPSPLQDKFRSAELKLLLPTPRIQWGSCGLSGEMRVNFTAGTPRGCDGTLTDWNPRSCSARSKLMLWSDHCRVYFKDDFLCIASMAVNDEFNLLITQDEHRYFSCWSVVKYPTQGFQKPWQRALLWRDAHCRTLNDLIYKEAAAPTIEIRTYDERMQQSCRKSNDGVLFGNALGEVTTSGATTPGARPAVQYKTTKDHNKGYEAEEQEYIKPRERKSGGSSIICSCAVLTTLSFLLGQTLMLGATSNR